MLRISGFRALTTLVSALLFFAAAAYAQNRWIFFNLSSQPNVLAAEVSADDYPALAKVKAVTDGSETYPVEVIGETVYIPAVIEPMSSAVMTPADDYGFGFEVISGSDDIKISFADFYVLAVRAGLFYNGEKLFSTGPDYKRWTLVHKSPAVVIVRKGQTEAKIFPTGLIKIRLEQNAPLRVEKPESVGLLDEFLVQRKIRPGDTLRGRFDSALFNENFLLAPAGPDILYYDSGSFAFREKDAELYILPCGNRKKWLGRISALAEPLIAKPHEDKLTVGGTDFSIDIFPENIDRPDFTDDRWHWLDKNGNKYAEWHFQKDTSGGTAKLKTYNISGRKRQEGLTFEDISARGVFLQGDLLRGGCVFCGYAGHYGAMDLDDDGDGDVFIHGHTSAQADVAQIDAGGFSFDMRDDRPANYFIESRKPGLFNVRNSRAYLGHISPYTWNFSKSIKPGLRYKGALRGFEEQVHYRVKSEHGEIIDGPAIMYLKTTDDLIDRLGMGAFAGHDRDNLDWNIQIDPLESAVYQPPSYRICEYSDPFGNLIRFTSSILPDEWDGKKLPMTVQQNGSIDFSPFLAWYKVSQRDYFDLEGFRAVFAPEGRMIRAAECMYSGGAHTGFRVEFGPESVRPLKLYYSELFAALHMKGASHGHQGFAAGHDMFRQDAVRLTLHRRDAVDMPGRFIGAREIDEIQGARIEGPMYLAYLDTDGDGLHDTYLYDAENNGLFDKVLRYDRKTGTLTLRQNEKISARQYSEIAQEINYLPGNYNIIENLYKAGLDNPPMVVRASLSSAGIPVENIIRRCPDTGRIIADRQSPDFFVTAGPKWNTTIALDTHHSGGLTGGWTDMSPAGMSTLAMRAAVNGHTPKTIDKPLDAETLGGTDILVIPSPIVPFTQDELLVLFEWVEGGGSLFIVPLTDEPAEKQRMAGLCGMLGVELIGQRIEADSSLHKYWVTYNQFDSETAGIQEYRYPSPDQRIEHFSSADPNLLAGFDFLTAVGFPLEIGKNFTPVLNYKDKTLIASAELDRGRIFISGINTFTCKYTGHCQHSQPKADNAELLGRLLSSAVEPKNKFKIEFISQSASSVSAADISFNISGKGGGIIIPALKSGLEVRINGKAVRTGRRGVLDTIEVPPGTNQITIREVANAD